jgi:hypothetical protein
MMQFHVSQWPEIEGQLRTFVTMTCDNFVEVLMRNKDSPFPR